MLPDEWKTVARATGGFYYRSVLPYLTTGESNSAIEATDNAIGHAPVGHVYAVVDINENSSMYYQSDL